jgi:hypothetical protein
MLLRWASFVLLTTALTASILQLASLDDCDFVVGNGPAMAAWANEKIAEEDENFLRLQASHSIVNIKVRSKEYDCEFDQCVQLMCAKMCTVCVRQPGGGSLDR